MSKIKTNYVCSNCKYNSPKWLGQCPECEEWNSFEEDIIVQDKYSKTTLRANLKATLPRRTSDITKKENARNAVGIGEFDRVLGGGLVNGQVTLITGAPGIGKSTLLTHIAQSLKGSVVLYVCGEENESQIKIRTDRMGYSGENLYLIEEKEVHTLAFSIKEFIKNKNVALVIVDSIQAIYSSDAMGLSGGLSQIRACAEVLVSLAKETQVPLILVGHVNKDGMVAGPKVLEHLVDTVLYFEGDNQHMFRILKTTKNRFGPVSEVGIFQLTSKGIEEVLNPSELFLSKDIQGVSGICTTSVMEGYRPLFLEIQCITNKSFFGYPKRTASGFSINRLQVLAAVLEKRMKISFSESDIFLNVSGGYKLSDYSSDIAVCLALYSSQKDLPILERTVAFGEVGFAGEIRNVPYLDQRVKEAEKLGYKNIISPKNCKNLQDAVNTAFGNSKVYEKTNSKL